MYVKSISRFVKKDLHLPVRKPYCSAPAPFYFLVRNNFLPPATNAFSQPTLLIQSKNERKKGTCLSLRASLSACPPLHTPLPTSLRPSPPERFTPTHPNQSLPFPYFQPIISNPKKISFLHKRIFSFPHISLLLPFPSITPTKDVKSAQDVRFFCGLAEYTRSILSWCGLVWYGMVRSDKKEGGGLNAGTRRKEKGYARRRWEGFVVAIISSLVGIDTARRPFLEEC